MVVEGKNKVGFEDLLLGRFGIIFTINGNLFFYFFLSASNEHIPQKHY